MRRKSNLSSFEDRFNLQQYASSRDDDDDDIVGSNEKKVEALMDLCVQTLITNRLFGDFLEKMESMCLPLNHLLEHRKCFEQRWYEKNANYFALKGDYFCMRAHERMKRRNEVVMRRNVTEYDGRNNGNSNNNENKDEYDADGVVPANYDILSGE